MSTTMQRELLTAIRDLLDEAVDDGLTDGEAVGAAVTAVALQWAVLGQPVEHLTDAIEDLHAQARVMLEEAPTEWAAQCWVQTWAVA